MRRRLTPDVIERSVCYAVRLLQIAAHGQAQ
jgi:hypothetical protein